VYGDLRSLDSADDRERLSTAFLAAFELLRMARNGTSIALPALAMRRAVCCTPEQACGNDNADQVVGVVGSGSGRAAAGVDQAG